MFMISYDYRIKIPIDQDPLLYALACHLKEQWMLSPSLLLEYEKELQAVLDPSSQKTHTCHTKNYNDIKIDIYDGSYDEVAQKILIPFLKKLAFRATSEWNNNHSIQIKIESPISKKNMQALCEYLGLPNQPNIIQGKKHTYFILNELCFTYLKFLHAKKAKNDAKNAKLQSIKKVSKRRSSLSLISLLTFIFSVFIGAFKSVQKNPQISRGVQWTRNLSLLAIGFILIRALWLWIVRWVGVYTIIKNRNDRTQHENGIKKQSNSPIGNKLGGVNKPLIKAYHPLVDMHKQKKIDSPHRDLKQIDATEAKKAVNTCVIL